MTTKNALMYINNGWLFNAQEGINKVYNEIKWMIIHRRVSSTVTIFHADEIKKFIEETHDKIVEINITGNRVCQTVEVRLNIDFDSLSESEFFELKKATKE